MESGRGVLGLTAVKVDKNGLTVHRENVLNSLMPRNRAQEITEKHFH